MAGFDQVNLYAEPSRMHTEAQRLAGVATRLGPTGLLHRGVNLPSGAFGAVAHSTEAQHAWQEAATVLTSYLRGTASVIEAMSEGVYRSAQEYSRLDARVSEMYRELMVQRDAGGAAPGLFPDAALITPAGIPPAGTHPEAVHDWWRSLGDEARRAVLSGSPERLGPLDGVPAESRDQANRTLLAAAVAEQEEVVKLSKEQPDVLVLTAAEERLAALEALQARLRADPQAFLLAIANDGDGRAIVALGNPDTARQVLTYVPGMTSDLGTVPEQIAAMDDVRTRAPERTAAVVWLGYDAPDDLSQVGFASYAGAAAEPLHRFQEGLRTTHQGVPSHNVLLAHSYGTTTYGIAAAEYGVSADKVYLIGSIGTTQETAHGLLGTPGDGVNVTTHRRDVAHVPPLFGYYGPDPSGVDFDAQQLPGAFDGDPVESHTSYLRQPDILDNIAALLRH